MAENLVKQLGETSLYVVSGDITQIPANALMTAINSGGMWFGGIDGAIQRVAGNAYHAQASARMPLSNGQVVVAKGNGRHRGKFDNVVFVVDDLQSSLSDVVYTGLEAATKEGYQSILIPTIRMGVMSGVVEKTPEEAVEKLGLGIARLMGAYGDQTSLKDIKVVVYNDQRTERQLISGLKNMKLE